MEGSTGSRSLLQAACMNLEGMVRGQRVDQLQQGSETWSAEGPPAVSDYLPQQQGPQQPVCEKLWWLSP